MEKQTNFSDAEIWGEETGSGSPENEPQIGNETDSSEEEEKESEPNNQSESADEESPDEDEEESEGEESDEEDEEEEGEGRASQPPVRTVPYGKFKEERERRKNLETEIKAEIQNIKDLIASLTTNQAAKSKTELSEVEDEITKEAQKLAEELDLDSEGLAKIIKSVVAVAERRKSALLTDELTEKLKLLDELYQEKIKTAEEIHYNNEWNDLLPTLKQAYPNATEKELNEAKALMKQISHSEKGGKVVKEGDREVFIPYDLDYIFFKHKKDFDVLLKVKSGKSGEIGRGEMKIGPQDETEEDLLDLEELTPEIIKRRQERDFKNKDKEKDYRIYPPVK